MSSNIILAKKCQTIIKNNTPEKSIDLISNIKNTVNNKKFGKEKALKIYILYSSQSIEYDEEKYRYNGTQYSKDINSNIKKASKYVKNTSS